jgi:hypothetical protein
MVDPNAATIAIVFAAFCWFGPDADQLKLIAPRQAAVPACWHEIFKYRRHHPRDHRPCTCIEQEDDTPTNEGTE